MARNPRGTELAFVNNEPDMPAMKRTVSLTSRSTGEGKSKITAFCLVHSRPSQAIQNPLCVAAENVPG
jgi:hypothetical protein